MASDDTSCQVVEVPGPIGVSHRHEEGVRISPSDGMKSGNLGGLWSPVRASGELGSPVNFARMLEEYAEGASCGIERCEATWWWDDMSSAARRSPNLGSARTSSLIVFVP